MPLNHTNLTQHLAASGKTWQAVLGIAQAVKAQGGRALLVGGCVRDALLGITPKDFDIEVYHLNPDLLERTLAEKYRLDRVGRSFCVLKLKGHEIDVAIPRRESKTGLGHQAFEIHGDPDMPFEEATARRDFTLNALMFDPLNMELIDPHSGVTDLESCVLRHVSAAFSEDPLRVLRGMQFIARFELEPHPDTVSLCQTIEPEDLAPERIFDEWKKLIVKGVTPSAGLRFLRDTGWVRYFPELADCIGCPQEPKWHPEGDVWVHTLHCMDAFARMRTGEEWEDLVVGLAVLCHDLGKPHTTFTELESGRIKSPGHEKAGEAPARALLARMTRHHDLIESVIPLVLTHDRPWKLHEDNSTDAAIRRLAKACGRIDRLVRVSAADTAGRPPLVGDFPAGPWLLERAQNLNVKDAAPKPLLQGRDLIARGMPPGKHFKPILERAYEAQLDGIFTSDDEAQQWLDENLGTLNKDCQ